MDVSSEPSFSASALNSLADRLASCHQIAELSDGNHNEAWTLAHSLSDLADSSEAFLKAVPVLLDDRLVGDDLIQKLLEVVTPLQHMLYHLEDPRFLRQLLDPLRQDWDKARSSGSTK